jgi:hypothetical protein
LAEQPIKILAHKKQKTQIMKLLINPIQLNLLTSSFHLIEGYGWCHEDSKLIKESKLPEYLVSILVQGQPAEIRISGYSRASVLSIAKNLFGKNATITGSVRLA